MTIDALIPHLLRPHWLWALVALPLLWWLAEAGRRRSNVWTTVVDPHLLPHLLEAQGADRRRWARWCAALAYLVAVFALAGPSWHRADQPLWQSRAPLVIAVDLSSATLAADLPPSRLLQVRAKLATLLRERDGGQVAMVAFAEDAFTVAPMTEDAANVALFLDALAPDVMPADGHRVDRAIRWSTRLLKRAGFERGDILLLTDRVDGDAVSAARQAAGDGARVSVLGVGSARGAPYRDAGGGIAQARLDEASLRQLADAGGGRYSRLAMDDGDLHALGVLAPQASADAANGGAGARTWQDDGHWLLPPLMLLALLAFRRRGAVAMLALALAWPLGAPRAAELWRRPDQVRHAHMQDGARAYRQGDFDAAAKQYGGVDSADAHYNRGNALAKAGRYPEALRAYDHALALQPGMVDAEANRRAVEAAMRRTPQDGTSSHSQPQRGPQQRPARGQSGTPQGAGKPGASQARSDADGQGDPAPPSTQSSGAQSPSATATPPPPVTPADRGAQQAADAAQRERMERAMQRAPGRSQRAGGEPPARRGETPAERERRIANEAWLQRVPDDPGGLLREKFRLEHQRRQQQGGGLP